jgi:hypothetical protein
LQKASKIIVALVCVVAVMGVALADVLYTLTVSNTMHLKLATQLELRNGAGTAITAYAWGEFDDNSLKRMYSETGDGLMHLYNLGNGAVNVQWTSTCPAGWQLWLVVDGETWTSGTSKTIAVGGHLDMEINMRELTANGGQAYSYDLGFNIVS